MSMARTVLTIAAAVVVLPIAMRARESTAVRAGVVAVAEPRDGEESRADPAQLRAYLQAVHGSNAVQCEVILSAFNAWGSSRAPDRDSTAWVISHVIYRRIDAAESLADLVREMQSGDDCGSRVAARLLGRAETPGARNELLAALRSDDAAIRRLGAIGLGFTGDSTTSASLVGALADRDARVRAAAAWALGAVN